jgi:hypothetical protein
VDKNAIGIYRLVWLKKLMRHLVVMWVFMIVVIVMVVMAILVGGDFPIDEGTQYLLRVGKGSLSPFNIMNDLAHLVGIGLDPQMLPVIRQRLIRTAV